MPSGSTDRMAVSQSKAGFSLRSRSVARRLARGEIYYALGRFAVARRAYSSLRVALEAIKGAPALPLATTSVFPDVDVSATVAALRRDGVALGLKLPSELRDEILAHGETQRFIPLQGGAPLSRSAIRDGRLPDGAPAVVGRVVEPWKCAAAQRVAFDPALVSIAGAYLGYRPPIVLTELHWSFVSPATASYRRQLGQTIDYHYDVGWFNFLYFFFYITAVDARSGAHAIIRGSHRKKPPGMLFHSARQSDDVVLAEYGAASELVIEGEAGTGFVEDASAFHKALVPDARERLAFFVRYG
jgi:hypothetical protein